MGRVIDCTRDEDGGVWVEGVISTELVDADNQRMDGVWLDAALSAWMRRGGVVTRMFDRGSPVAQCARVWKVGPEWFGEIRVIDEKTQVAVLEGALRGIGIGVKKAVIHKDEMAPNGLICGGDIYDVSLLDEPLGPAIGSPWPVGRKSRWITM